MLSAPVRRGSLRLSSDNGLLVGRQDRLRRAFEVPCRPLSASSPVVSCDHLVHLQDLHAGRDSSVQQGFHSQLSRRRAAEHPPTHRRPPAHARSAAVALLDPVA